MSHVHERMRDEHHRLTAFLQKAQAAVLSSPEPTLFSVGGRGYFENPTTDLLAFYLNPTAPHGLGDLVLRSLLKCVGFTEDFELSLVEPPHREETTANRNRIDLVLVGPSWVAAIENKIGHAQVNPFEDYEQHLVERYPGREALRIVLSPAGTTTRATWVPLSYRRLIDSVREQMKEHGDLLSPSKWAVFLHEFLLHLENEATEKHMTDEQMAFVEGNYALLARVAELRQQYHRTIEQRATNLLRQQFPTHQIKTRVHDWGAGPAIRFYSDRWGESNPVIHLGSDAGDSYTRVSLYATGLPADGEALSGAFGSGLSYWTESGGAWHCWSALMDLGDHKSLLTRFIELVAEFDVFLTARQSPPL